MDKIDPVIAVSDLLSAGSYYRSLYLSVVYSRLSDMASSMRSGSHGGVGPASVVYFGSIM